MDWTIGQAGRVVAGWDVGRWVAVDLADGTTRHDWVPDDQPPSPDGASGRWHAVGAPGEPGVWEWHPDSADPLTAVTPPPAVTRVGAHAPVARSSSVLVPPAASPVPAGRSEKRPRAGRGARMRPAAGAPRPGEISTPIAIVSILAALAVLAAVVLFFVTRDHGTSSDSTVSNASAAVATPVRSTSTGPTTSGTPLPGALPPGADKTFPKVSGDWTLFTVTIDKDAAGNFTGTGVIRYDGDTGATGVFDLAVFSGGRQVGTLHAGLSDVKPHTQTTVTWTSGDTWVEQMDGFAFHAS